MFRAPPLTGLDRRGGGEFGASAGSRMEAGTRTLPVEVRQDPILDGETPEMGSAWMLTSRLALQPDGRVPVKGVGRLPGAR